MDAVKCSCVKPGGLSNPGSTSARRIASRLQFHYTPNTPKHGSSLNTAEIEFSVFARQCLDRRIPDELTLKRECAALEFERNRVHASVNWQFTSRDARTKLKNPYPHN